MSYKINCIYNYYDTLLSVWSDWNVDFLFGKFVEGAKTLTEALGMETSDGRSRAKELYRIGLLNQELSKGMAALNASKEGYNLQSRLGFLSAIIYNGFRHKPTAVLRRAIGALNTIYTLLQSVEINNKVFSINFVIHRLLEDFPLAEGYDIYTWIRYLFSAFCCELKEGSNTNQIMDFLSLKSSCPTLRILEYKTNDVRAIIAGVEDLKQTIDNRISLTNIYHQKAALFLLGNLNEGDPRGFYGMALKYFNTFLDDCHKIEKAEFPNSFLEIICSEKKNALKNKGQILETLKVFSNYNQDFKNSYIQIMKTIEEGALEALCFMTDKPSDSFEIKNRVILPATIDNNRSKFIAELTAIRTKPFVLLAGISGTGKSRLVRKLAQATVTEKLQKEFDKNFSTKNFSKDRWNLHNPANFELIQVKPNWHSSMDVIGYLSNIPIPHYVFTPFINFIIRAWLHPDIPFFLCLDEMNLAPVEQYFAEFLSAIESRSFENGQYITDPIIKPFNEFGIVNSVNGNDINITEQMLATLLPNFKECGTSSNKGMLVNHLRTRGLTLPQNLIVMGTVNMDDSTKSFSRKVLDRAMSIEMNEVDYDSFLINTTDDNLKSIVKASDDGTFIDKNGNPVTIGSLLVNRHIEAKEVVEELGEDAKFVINYLKKINTLLNGTPFKLGYRTANEALIYLRASEEFGNTDREGAMDKFTLMKILSRIAGDASSLRISDSEEERKRLSCIGIDINKARKHGELTLLTALRELIANELGEFVDNPITILPDSEGTPEDTNPYIENAEIKSLQGTNKLSEVRESISKLDNMIGQIEHSYSTTYWT